MQSVLDKLTSLDEEHQAMLPISTEQQEKLEKKFRLEFSYNSNHIEGNTLTYGETELLLFFDDTRGNHTYREYEEMKAHDVAYQMIREWAADKERTLMNYVLLSNNFPPIVIKSAEKRSYLSALNDADTGDLAAFIKYIALQLVWSLELSIKAAKGESVEEPDDLDKEITLLQRQMKEDVIKKPANSEIIADTILENIIPVFRSLEKKCESLKELFLDFDRKISINFGKSHAQYDEIVSNDSSWDSLVENWLQKNIREDEKDINTIRYSFALRGYKKAVSAPSFWLNIEVKFDTYNYTIITDQNRNQQTLQYPYGNNLGANEMADIISPVVRYVIEELKRLNGSN